jgi:hypothetical protein
MLGFSSGGILDRNEHEAESHITQTTADELLVSLPLGAAVRAAGLPSLPAARSKRCVSDW